MMFWQPLIFLKIKLASVMFTTSQKEELVGKIAKYPIDQGVVITRTMVSDGEVAAGGPEWAAQYPAGDDGNCYPDHAIGICCIWCARWRAC